LATAVQVQLNDDYSLHELLVQYNQYCRNNIDDSESYKYWVSESAHQVDMPIMENTVTYSTQGLQSVSILAAVNGNGKVSSIVVLSPISMERTQNALYAYRLLMALDPRNMDSQGVLEKVAYAVAYEKLQHYYSPTNNRHYSIMHHTTSNGNLTLIEAWQYD
jgi:hypothetical protein